MKKRILSLLLLALLTALWIPLPARAAAQVDLRVTATPDSMLTSGNVTLNVSISVAALTSDEITNAELFMTGGSTALYTWRSIHADSSVTESIPGIYISEQQLGSTIPMELHYSDGGQRKIAYTSVSVFRGVPQTIHESGVRFTREASAETAAAGTPVTLSYWIGNTGSQPIYDINIQDPVIGTVGTRNVLYPGESIPFTSAFTLKETTASTPVLTYKELQGGAVTSKTLETLTILLAEAKLSVTLDADVKEIRAGEAVRFTYNIINEGNIPFYNLQISDDTGGMIPGRDELPAGGSYVYTRKENLVKSGEFYFQVSGADSMGGAIQVKSNIVSVSVIDVAADSAQPALDILTLSVSPNVTQLTQPGEVKFDITVRNLAGEAILDLVLSEATAGDFERMDKFSGDKTFVFTANVSAPTSFAFAAQGRLASGERVRAQSATVEIAFESPQQQATTPPWEQPSASPAATTVNTPESAATPEPVPAPSSNSRASLLLIALGVVVLLIIVVVIALVAVSRRNSRHTAYDAQAYSDYDEDDPYYAEEGEDAYPSLSDDFGPEETPPPPYGGGNEATRPIQRKPPSTDDVPTRPVKRH